MSDVLDQVTWFRGTSVRIRRAGLEIHIDPIGVTDDSRADYILLTHPHYDNFSEADIDRVRTEQTVVVAPTSMKKLLADADHFMRPGDMLQFDGLDVLAVPAHNVVKRFHPPEKGWLGYVFTLGNVTYYHAGHTDFLDSMSQIRCDVAFLPCCSAYTMGPEEAAQAGEACGASILVPIHWGEHPETPVDAGGIEMHFSGTVQFLERKA